VTRSPATALGDHLFHRLSGVVSSETVVAHVRKATQGSVSVLNCHPFQYGRWVFAHNGDIPGFENHRAELLRRVDPALRRFVLGDTDSELIFHLLLSRLRATGPLSRPHEVEDVVACVRATVAEVRALCERPGGEPCLLTLMLSDGESLIAHQGGKELFLSTYKTRCADRDNCPSLSAECEAPSTTGRVNHCIVSSEPLQGENIWQQVRPGEIVGVDRGMRLTRHTPERRPLTVVA
jgi:glutamine amidotransferase